MLRKDTEPSRFLSTVKGIDLDEIIKLPENLDARGTLVARPPPGPLISSLQVS